METNPMVCTFCGLDVIVLCEVGLCSRCFARLDVEAAEFEAGSPVRIVARLGHRSPSN